MAVISRNDKGDEVARLQALLCVSGIDCRPVDGDFGAGTERAVRRCQERAGLPVTGAADDATQTVVGMDEPDSTKAPVPVIGQMTADLVAAMFSRFTPRANIEQYLPRVLSAVRDADMDDRDMVLMALATIRAETEGFEPISEKPSKYNTDPGVHPFNRYDNRAALGNRGAPDGERFKGRGFIQLTGRDNYRKYGEAIGLGARLIDNPDLANDPQIAARLLVQFIKDKRGSAKYALLGRDLKTARKLVNGGSHGLERFTEAFEKGERLLEG